MMDEFNISQLPARRKNRIAAIQFLYTWELDPTPSHASSFEAFLKNFNSDPNQFVFAKDLICGTLENIAAIDEKIKHYSQNWQFNRIAKIELAILRLAIFELLFRKDIPPIASINEAIDLTKFFSTPDSKRFINGILDKIKDEIDRPLRTPTPNNE